MQYLYPEGGDYVFMDLESYEQIHLGCDVLVSQEGFLLPNEEVQINFYNEQPIGVELPATVALEVAETETVIKGQTAAGSGKPAVLETGLRVVVPTFVSVGDRIRINTETGEYVERADR
jgi:elongation factor P